MGLQNRFLLWANAIIFSMYLAAHLFDIFILVPNWRGGTLEEIRLYNAFFHETDPRHFFSVIRPVSISISLLCLVLYWARGTPMRVLLLITLLIDILIYMVTLYFFKPINDYLFLDDSVVFDGEIVKEYASKWVASNYIRIALTTVGFYAALRAVHFSYLKK